MELRQLVHFLAVVDNGSFSDAARKLRLSQPALTTSIQALERSLGVRLFERSHQGALLTAAGHTLEIRARLASAELKTAEQEIGELQDARRGRVTIGCGSVFANSILPRVIAQFRPTHPEIQFGVTEGLYREIVPHIERGTIECGVYSLPPTFHSAELVKEILIPRNRFHVVTSPKNPLAKRRKVSLQEIWPGPWLLPRVADQVSLLLTETFRKAGLPPIVPLVEVSSGILAKEILRENPTFLTLTQELLVRDELRTGVLHALPVAEAKWVREVSLLYRKGGVLTGATQEFLKVVRAVCADLAR